MVRPSENDFKASVGKYGATGHQCDSKGVLFFSGGFGSFFLKRDFQEFTLGYSMVGGSDRRGHGRGPAGR